MVNIYFICVIAVIIILSIFGVKNENTFRKRHIVLKAIRDYAIDCSISLIEHADMYNRMESYESTLFRLWDWGYTRIVDEETFELIKPYIKKGKKTNE